MGLLLGLPVWPEAGAIALGLESIRGHDPEGGFEDEPTEQAAPSEPQAMIIAPAEPGCIRPLMVRSRTPALTPADTVGRADVNAWKRSGPWMTTVLSIRIWLE